MSQPQNPSMPMITPTQTVEASQLNNKTQILNQFQSPAGAMMSPAPRPAPGIPNQVPAPAPTQPQPGNISLIQSPSFTEPGPVEFEDNFFGSQSSTEQVSDNVDGSSTFYIEESNQNHPQSSPVEVTTAEEDKHDGIEDASANKDATGEQPDRKTSFWSGLWNRSKDHGSKENILDDAEKKENDDGEY